MYFVLGTVIPVEKCMNYNFTASRLKSSSKKKKTITKRVLKSPGLAWVTYGSLKKKLSVIMGKRLISVFVNYMKKKTNRKINDLKNVKYVFVQI